MGKRVTADLLVLTLLSLNKGYDKIIADSSQITRRLFVSYLCVICEPSVLYE